MIIARYDVRALSRRVVAAASFIGIGAAGCLGICWQWVNAAIPPAYTSKYVVAVGLGAGGIAILLPRFVRLMRISARLHNGQDTCLEERDGRLIYTGDMYREIALSDVSYFDVQPRDAVMGTPERLLIMKTDGTSVVVRTDIIDRPPALLLSSLRELLNQGS